MSLGTRVARCHLVLAFRTDISIDGNTAISFTEDVNQRFLSYGWQVLVVEDGDR